MTSKDILQKKSTVKVTMAIQAEDFEVLRKRGDEEGSSVYELIRRILHREVRKIDAGVAE